MITQYCPRCYLYKLSRVQVRSSEFKFILRATPLSIFFLRAYLTKVK
jgi:hypothetical protein